MTVYTKMESVANEYKTFQIKQHYTRLWGRRTHWNIYDESVKDEGKVLSL